jgi:pantoate--beta-alanine ligase
MQVIEKIAELRGIRLSLKGSIGLVPTMGYLHEGHLTLVRESRRCNQTTFATIFVNPTQFGPGEDFERYPRDFPRDFALLKKEKCDFVFVPSPGEIYPAGFDTWVEVKGVTGRLEGDIRPGHFRGVATIVAKLFNLIQPSRAYFGQKDAQQCAVLRKMVADLNMPLEMIVVPTVRESDGLAMSSRNVYLNAEERRQAPVLFQALQLAHVLWSEGEHDTARLRRSITDLIGKKPLAEIQYISIADGLTLEELTRTRKGALISLAVKFGRTRLIDNLVLE